MPIAAVAVLAALLPAGCKGSAGEGRRPPRVEPVSTAAASEPLPAAPARQEPAPSSPAVTALSVGAPPAEGVRTSVCAPVASAPCDPQTPALSSSAPPEIAAAPARPVGDLLQALDVQGYGAFRGLLGRAGLADRLLAGGVTVLAPTDRALARLLGQRPGLDRAGLRRLVRGFLVEGVVDLDELIRRVRTGHGVVRTLAGTRLAVEARSDGTLRIGGAVVAPRLWQGASGVLHGLAGLPRPLHR